jgi:pyruvate dehydrogenase E1 component
MLQRVNPTPALDDPNDSDPTETAEWLDALESVFRVAGGERAEFILSALDRKAKDLGVVPDLLPFGPYQNTIPLEKQGPFPGDLDTETRITAIIRWNALAMVVRANACGGELGGHVASYASGAEIFEVGFNHFFRGTEGERAGDVVFFQPHSAPGVYARAFLEGRLTEERLKRYRQEIGAPGLSSYPHPWMMPDFWQTPTGSMGIGPISAVYQARFMRYLSIVVSSTRMAGASGGIRRRRDGRARINCRPLPRRARETRQPDLHHQLQSAAT